MKKLKLLALAAAMVFSVMLVGCESDDRDDNTDQLEDEIERLEQELKDVKNGQSSQSSESSSSDTQAFDPSKTDIDSLTTEVNDVIAKVEGAAVSESADDRRTQFFELKDELHSVEHRMDAYDDYMEAQYKQGALSYEDYRAIERNLESLEDKLDLAEDKLELTFGIDD